MSLVYTFSAVIDIEGPDETTARECLERQLDAFLNSEENMDAEWAALGSQVLYPAIQIIEPESYYDDLTEPEDDFILHLDPYDDESGLETLAGDPDES